MKKWIKRFAANIPLLFWFGVKISWLRGCLFPIRGHNNKVMIKGNIIGLKKNIIGDNNVVEIFNSTVRNSSIKIRGNGNHLVIEEGCTIGKGCSFWLEGNNNTIIIGKKNTMTMRCHFNAQEHDTKIIVGEDCMFSNTIIVRTSDSHPIYDNEGTRINPAKDILIGKHVWIAPNTVIMKGAIIGDGCIIGSHSMVNKNVPSNSLSVGMPSKVVKEGVVWTRENVIF